MYSARSFGRFFPLVLAGFITFGAAGKSSAGFVIDNFNVRTIVYPGSPGFQQNTVGSQNHTEIGLPPASTVGGVRNSTLAANVIVDSDQDNVAYRIGAGGQEAYSSTDGANGSLSQLYDGGTGDLNKNVTGDVGVTILVVSFDYAFSAPLSITVTLFDGAVSNSVTKIINNAIGVPTPFLFPYASFPTVDKTSINSFTVRYDGGQSSDFTVDEVDSTAAPEPTSLILGSMGIASLFGYGLRRARRVA